MCCRDDIVLAAETLLLCACTGMCFSLSLGLPPFIAWLIFFKLLEVVCVQVTTDGAKEDSLPQSQVSHWCSQQQFLRMNMFFHSQQTDNWNVPLVIRRVMKLDKIRYNLDVMSSDSSSCSHNAGQHSYKGISFLCCHWCIRLLLGICLALVRVLTECKFVQY